MKKLMIVCIAAILLTACKSQNSNSWAHPVVSNACPEKNECTVEVMDNKSLLVKSDDTGHVYYQLEDDPGKKVVQYTLRRITDPNLMDAGYSETLTFETDDKYSNLNSSGINMQKTKMLLGVQCFCRGKAGFYKVESGNISYTNHTLNIQVPGIVDGQTTKEVGINFK